jgi:hypothetical protein
MTLQRIYDFVSILSTQNKFSNDTFGPGMRTKGVVAHIRSELDEIEKDPTDLTEWIDVAILAFDGAWRTGATPDEIWDAYVAKLEKNMAREWPDWRTMDEDKPIEHVKGIND